MHVVVTGASQGIGRATALRLAQNRAALALHYHRHSDEARKLAQEVAERRCECFTVQADLAAPDGPREIAGAITQAWDRVDVLILNAGTYPRRRFQDLSPSEFLDCFRLHVFGPAELVQRLLPLLERSPSGRVIFVSSVLAFSGSRHGAHYAGAKAAQLGLARSLALELAPRITVNVVVPGSIDTAILAGDSPEQHIQRERAIPLGRIGRPEEVAEAIAFLASPGAAYLTGTTIHVNGGLRFD